MNVRRIGTNIIEVLIVLGILGTLIAILVPAIMKVRETANRAKGLNQLKQIGLACHQYAEQHGGRLPTDGPSMSTPFTSKLVPHLGGWPDPQRYYYMPAFISPVDPTFVGPEVPGVGHLPLCSYAGNAFLFPTSRGVSLHQEVADGLSQTVLFGERYTRCSSYTFLWNNIPPMGYELRAVIAQFLLYAAEVKDPSIAIVRNSDGSRATFQTKPCPAFSQQDDGTRVDLKEACGSRPICNYGLAQTSYAAGALTAMADGSVRTVRPGVDPATYWAAFTPAGGEPLTDW